MGMEPKRKSTNQHNGRILTLQPHNATIFTNDQQTRSFLAIPVSDESARWVKQMFLPSIDAAMLRFGLETYYTTEEEGCILHVSFASVKGNVIPHILRCRGQRVNRSGNESNENESKIRSTSLFSNHCAQHQDIGVFLKSIPRYIPIRVHQIECEFGKAKKLSISF